MFNPGPCVYMEKIAVGPEGAGRRSTSPRSLTENLQAVAKAKGESVRDVTAVILDRDRHDDLIAEVRAAGARIRLIPDGDVAGAISTAWPDSGADILFGIGGTPEGVIAAAALKCMGGEIQGRLWPRNDDERAGRHRRSATTSTRCSPPTTSCAGDNCFFAATGITDGELLKGVHYDSRGATTQSLVMRSKSGTVRSINARHRLDKLQSSPRSSSRPDTFRRLTASARQSAQTRQRRPRRRRMRRSMPPKNTASTTMPMTRITIIVAITAGVVERLARSAGSRRSTG